MRRIIKLLLKIIGGAFTLLVLLLAIILCTVISVANPTDRDLRDVRISLGGRPIWQGDILAGRSNGVWGFSGALDIEYNFGDQRVSNRCYLTGILDGYHSYMVNANGVIPTCEQLELRKLSP